MFLGPQSIVTNQTIREIVDNCGDFLEVEDLAAVSNLDQRYSSEIHSVVGSALEERYIDSPRKRHKRSKKRSLTLEQATDLSTKRRPLGDLQLAPPAANDTHALRLR